jgi:hypothetical protein
LPSHLLIHVGVVQHVHLAVQTGVIHIVRLEIHEDIQVIRDIIIVQFRSRLSSHYHWFMCFFWRACPNNNSCADFTTLDATIDFIKQIYRQDRHFSDRL